MINFLHYATVVGVWGASWIAIHYQVDAGGVAPEVSVAYRFLLASFILMGFCLVTGRRLGFSLRAHGTMALQGVFLFSTNFYLIYLSSQYLPSGLVSIVFSTLVLWNIINSMLFIKTSIGPRLALGATIGLAGLSVVFLPELQAFNLSDEGIKGLLLGVAGTISASFGMMLSVRNQKLGLPVLQSNAWGMFYGFLVMVAIALVAGKPFTFSATPAYVLSLVYVSLFASVIGFGAYLKLLGRIGPARAAYVSVLFPVVALTISTFVEAYQWTPTAISGIALVLWGNLLVLTKPGTIRALLRRSLADVRHFQQPLQF